MKKRKLACETTAGDLMATPYTARKVPKTDQRPTRADSKGIHTGRLRRAYICTPERESPDKTKSGEDYGVDEIDIQSKKERYNEQNPTD